MFSLVAWCTPTSAQPVALKSVLPREHHQWGRFSPGAWRRVRVVSENMDDAGEIVGTTTRETQITLKDVTDHDVLLEFQTTREVAGQQFRESQVFRQGFSGELKGYEPISIRQLGNATVLVDGRHIPCKLRRVEMRGPRITRTISYYYSDKMAPYVLKQQSVSSETDDTSEYETTVDVIAMNMPYKVLAEIKSTSYVKTVHKNARGTTFTLEVHCESVPGGVVAHSSKELSGDGKLLRRSTLELIDYGLDQVDEAGQSRIPRRRQLLRSQRTTRESQAPRQSPR